MELFLGTASTPEPTWITKSFLMAMVFSAPAAHRSGPTGCRSVAIAALGRPLLRATARCTLSLSGSKGSAALPGRRRDGGRRSFATSVC